MLSVYQAEGNNKCKEQMYNESRMYTASLFPVNVFQLALKEKITRDSALFSRKF